MIKLADSEVVARILHNTPQKSRSVYRAFGQSPIRDRGRMTEVIDHEKKHVSIFSFGLVGLDADHGK